MSFANHGRHGDKLEWSPVYWFEEFTENLPVAHEEDILSSEFRIYKQNAVDRTTEGSGQFTIKVFRLVNGSVGEKDILDSKTLDYSYEGMFKLT